MPKNSFILKILYLYHTLSLVKSNIIKTTTGPVRGKPNYYGKISYYSYEGIPFAEPPLGDLRFMPPVPIKPWKHVLDAKAPCAVCPQREYYHIRSEMDENCLFLNVYVPDNKPAKLLPVIFVVHGGYYHFQSGNPQPIYGPQLLLEREMIVVTTNYRLGALGFLSFDDIQASGNAGLKDILLASKWVKSSIEKFGGDPKKICSYGMDSGSSLAHLLLLTKQSTGIFRSAFLTSGSALSYRAIQINPKQNALKLARHLGITYSDKRCLNRLKDIDAFEIIKAEDYIIRNDLRRGFILVNLFAPTVEKPSSIALITRNPLDIIRTDGLIQNIPIATGFNNQEGLEIFVALKDNPDVVNKLNQDFELCIPPDIRYPPHSQERKDLAKSIREFYFGGGDISIVNTQNYINLITDTAYAYGIDYWIKLYKSRKNSAPVYYYVFTFDGQLNWGKRLEGTTYPGASYGDGIGYFFVTNVTENKFQNLDYKSRFILEVAYLTLKNLAIYGNPTLENLEDAEWFETDINRSHMVIDYKPEYVNEPPLQKRLGFWYKEYAKYYEYERMNKT